ncbi:DNA topoisomerase III [Salipaludibacillus aurantiacus]|uniref:DNA topoisomerase 3 n=1 Tax=Salipaludibacillus aurantiacus TaxID=1601833 RepID=A0A1H9U329_9BACI|nr:DNA topoisomerase III [Salipaludibacillus aurantiacus]SES03564.1 DNA topoisomerase-3 [Salipaludibacillus aurantiacus]
MKKSVVIAEKPSVARDIAKVMNCHKKGNGFIEGDKYIVTWALGHLVTHADPEAYDNKYKSWKLEDLPMLPSPLKLTVIKQTGKQFQTVKTQLHRKDAGQVIIATDAGREGELVARWILEKAKVKKPVKRLWISSVTDKAIKEGFQNLKDGRKYESLYYSAVARAEADWYVGLNATRALTCKFNAQLSSGRVQTPTLAMIAKREEEIRQFKPQTYFGVKADTREGVQLTWQDKKSNSYRTFSEETADQVKSAALNSKANINEVNKKNKKTFAPQLYDLTEIQREANRLFNYSAKETLSILQKLYEQHKVLTYPRTDSRYLSSDMVSTLPDRIKACKQGDTAKIAHKLLQRSLKPHKSFVDDSKVRDHHAIVPTEEPPLMGKLSNKEWKLYDLVVKRFLAVMMPLFEYEETTVKAIIGKDTFIARGKRVLELGWRELYEQAADDGENAEEQLDDQRLPELHKGGTLTVTNARKTKGETKPPSRFNEATLLSAMENPSKYIGAGNKQLGKLVVKTGGLGTVATRADIIEKLFSSFLIEKNGKELVITSKGKQLLELVPADLKSPLLTGEWEQKLEAIAQNKLLKEEFISEIKSYTKTIVTEIKTSSKKYKHTNLTGTKCPECDKNMLEVKTKKGKMHVCQDRECGYRKNITKTTNARCPKCKKKLELRGQGEGQVFVCKCGHKEKLSAFNERKKKEQNTKLSKREVSNYMKKQDKTSEEPFNNALAEQLAKLKK